MDTNQLNDLLDQLKAARGRLGAVKLQRDETMALLMQDPDYVQLTDACQLHGEEVAAIETEIRKLALAEYEANQNKTPHPKVTVKLFSTFKIVDPAKVLAWVKTNLADALVVDEAKVKSYAMKIGNVEGTEKDVEARAQIATTL